MITKATGGQEYQNISVLSAWRLQEQIIGSASLNEAQPPVLVVLIWLIAARHSSDISVRIRICLARPSDKYVWDCVAA